ncbi:MAG: WcaI family glycosyltransferase [Dehalococcoidia bacterium]
MTRLLITSMYYEPDETGIGPYTTRLAEHLAHRGYDVTAVTGMPHYPSWRVAEAYRGKMTVREVRNGVRLLRRRHYVPSKHGALHRAAYEATFFASALTALRLPRPHAVLGVVPALSGGVLARVAARKFDVPYGLVFQDMTAEAARQSGVPGGGRVAGVVRLAEAWAAQRASAIGIVAEGFRPCLEAMGVEPSRIRRVRNWTRTAPVTMHRDDVRARFAWDDAAARRTVVLHAGNMGAKQGLETVIEAARIAQGNAPGLLFVLMGDGSQRAALEAMTNRYALENVRFLPLQPDAMLPNILAAADVLLVNQRGSVRDMALPSKLTAYFAAGRPVVAAVAEDSETAREINWSSGGILAQPDDPRALLAAIERGACDPGLQAHLSRSARDWSDTVLSEATALRSYEQLVASVLRSAGRGRVHALGRIMRPVERASQEGSDQRWAA